MRSLKQVAVSAQPIKIVEFKVFSLRFSGCRRTHPSCTQDVLQDLSGSRLLVFVLLQQVVLPSSFYNLKDRSAKCERHRGFTQRREKNKPN